MAELPKEKNFGMFGFLFVPLREDERTHSLTGEVMYMKRIQNCWEFKKCGREPGGAMAERLGVCHTAIATFANGLNGGMNGGRICWAINGNFINEDVSCMHCDFFYLLEGEELSVGSKK